MLQIAKNTITFEDVVVFFWYFFVIKRSQYLPYFRSP